MHLADVNVGDEVTILALHCEKELKARLMTFGIIKGALVSVAYISLAKNTIEIVVDDTAIALRMEEAKLVDVSEINEND